MKVLNKPKKSMGQNFLIDQNIIKKIIKIGNIDTDKKIIEIGAGYGSLTEQIAQKYPKKILAVEKDKALALILIPTVIEGLICFNLSACKIIIIKKYNVQQ